MVFMKDSERAATMAQERGIEASLHLNLTTLFSAPGCPARLVERQQELARYLLRHRLVDFFFSLTPLGALPHMKDKSPPHRPVN
jgi:hypothetical protein